MLRSLPSILRSTSGGLAALAVAWALAPLARADYSSCAVTYALMGHGAWEMPFLTARTRAQLAEGWHMLEEDLERDYTRLSFHPELRTLANSLQAESRARVAALEVATSLTEKRRLAREISQITRALMEVREAFGREVVVADGRDTAKQAGALVLLRNVSAVAVGKISHRGVGKSLEMKFHSATEGVIAGLIPYDQRLSAKVARAGSEEIARKQAQVEMAIANGLVRKQPYRVGPLAAVVRKGKVIFVDTTRETVDPASVVEVLVENTGEGRFVVSDVDALAFAFPDDAGAADVARAQGSLGIISDRQKKVVQTYNRVAGGYVKERGERPLFMMHGPETENPLSEGVEGYPITAFFPNGEVRVVEKANGKDPDANLKAFFREANEMGYRLKPNPRWGWKEL